MDVLIIGTGNIGKRHLQGASFLPVSCYDISRDSLESVRPFCESNKIRIPKLLPELDDALNTITPETVVIVATTANGRVPLFKKIVSRNPREVILEKPACQSLSEYKQLMKITGEGEVYVNIPRTLYPVYQQIGLEGKHAMFFANSSNAGMVCNGIHVIALACWLLKAESYKILFSRASQPYETKRKGFYDFSGQLILQFGNGSTAIIRDTEYPSTESYDIICDNELIRIMEPQKQMVVVRADGSAECSNIELPFVSQTTGAAIRNLQAGRRAGLPSLSDAFLSHKILFDMMKANSLDQLNIT